MSQAKPQPLSTDELRQEIELWAPQKYREKRGKLYANLRAAGIELQVLMAIKKPSRVQLLRSVAVEVAEAVRERTQ